MPILDTGFVVAKRLKYRQPIYKADRWHFHHRMANIGFSQRRTLAYLYGWTLVMAALALALRFVPYSDDHGHFDAALDRGDGRLRRPRRSPPASTWSTVLEILKLRQARLRQLCRLRRTVGAPVPEAGRSTARSSRSSRPAPSRPSIRRPASSRRSTDRR